MSLLNLLRNLATIASLSSIIGPNQCDLYLLEVLIHKFRTLIQTLQFHIQLSIVVVRHKSSFHQHFHLLPRCYWPLSTPPATNHILIPPNQCVIHEFNDYQFHILCLRIVMPIKNPIHLFLPLKLHLGIVSILKRWYFQFDSILTTIYIIMSPKVMEMSPLVELAPSFIPKVPLVSRMSKTFPMAHSLILKILIISSPWPFSPTIIV